MIAMCHRRFGVATSRCGIDAAMPQNCGATKHAHSTAQHDAAAAPPFTVSGSR
ncbi:molybdopterin biosynthesis protein [Xanthomonas axonopodis pv. vasculorum]|nr:molybdopterin biosynthesis protein [Xanthomonas axonopodis pv. vasculorum]